MTANYGCLRENLSRDQPFYYRYARPYAGFLIL